MDQNFSALFSLHLNTTCKEKIKEIFLAGSITCQTVTEELPEEGRLSLDSKILYVRRTPFECICRNNHCNVCRVKCLI